MYSVLPSILLLASQALSLPFTSSPPLLVNGTASSNSTTQLKGSGVREYIFEDALEVLLAASPTHDEFNRASKKMREFNIWESIDLINDDISTWSDGSPIGPDTPPQELEQKQARDFASYVRESAPHMKDALSRVRHASIWDLRWNPNVRSLHQALRQIVLFAFTRVYFQVPEGWQTAMEIFDSMELGDIIMWINDSKETDGDKSGRLSTQSTVDDLWNKCHVQDLERLCEALNQKTLDWSHIPWPEDDSLDEHEKEIAQSLKQNVGGTIEVVA